MRDEEIEEECQALAVLTEGAEAYEIIREGLIEQISKENGYSRERAITIVESATRWHQKPSDPQRVTAVQLGDGPHRLPSGGLLFVKDGHIQELHAPTAGEKFRTDHDAREVTVHEANKLARREFDVASMWKRTAASWVASWFRRERPRPKDVLKPGAPE